MTTIRTAIIVGGGIAGPVTAMALQRAGIEATVHEAYRDTADGVGGMLGLAPNGLNAFAVLDLADQVRSVGEPVSQMVMASGTGKVLGAFGDPDGPPFLHAVWRAELYRVLYDEAARRGVQIRHGQRLVDAVTGPNGVTARFDDGSTATADVLIGADGIRSTVRGLIDPNAPEPRYTGLLGFGGWTEGTGVPATRGAMHLVHGKRAFFGYSVDERGRAGWVANLPAREPRTYAQAQAVDPERWLRTLRDAFADDRMPARDILRHVDPADLISVGALEGMPSVPTWSRDRMVLVGDSVHAPSPSSGQGVSLAVESAVQLARCLRDLPHPEAFAAYEALRRPRVEKVIAMAQRTNSRKAAGPVARVLRDLTMPVLMKLVAKPEKMAWQHDYRIDWAEPVTGAPAVPVGV